MSSPKTIRYVSIAVGAVWTTVLYLSGIKLPTFGQQVVANIPTALLVLTIAFDLWLWKIPGMNRLHGRPQIGGTWTTTVTPHPDSHIPDGGNAGPISGITVIEQTFWTLAVTMQTGESESVSRAESIAPDGGSRTRKVLTYTYTNTPQMAVRHRSPIHVGATMLTIDGPRPDTLTGIYWTGRLTIGDLTLTRNDG
jgi:hypothetical protein